ncbi:MAG: UvrD-helicase domain-containing protein [bacterium]
MNLLYGLNKLQDSAVHHYRGPLIVLAGPGSGKTRVITYRISYLIREHHIPPENILAVTFTNKAAQEMLNRLYSNELLGETVGMEVWIHTFHSACVRILRQYGERIGLNPRFAIIDQNDQELLISQFLRDLNSPIPKNHLWLIRDFISDAKIKLENPIEVKESERLRRFNENKNDNTINIDIYDILDVVKLYQEFLATHDILDFDDLVSMTVKLLKTSEDVKLELQKKFQFIMIDEYQDINLSQYELVTHLCNPENNIMVVADDDQSIYSWRGSNLTFIDKFKERYKPKIIQLVDHYRSTKNILRASQSLIEKNSRIKKGSLLTSNDKGEVIYHYRLGDTDEEQKLVLWLIRRLINEKHYSPGQIAIFYRTHKLADKLEHFLIKNKVAVRRIYKESFFHDTPFHAILGYLRFLCWGLEPDLEKSLSFPDPIIDELTKLQLKKTARNDKISLMELLRNIDNYDDIGPLTRKRVRDFVNLIDKFPNDPMNTPIDQIIKNLFEVLSAERSPYHSADLNAIGDSDKLGNLWLAINTLYGAIQQKSQIEIITSYGIDNYCSAGIIIYVLENYLNIGDKLRYHFLPSDDIQRKHIINKIAEKSLPEDDFWLNDNINNQNDTLYIIIGSLENLPEKIIERSILLGDVECVGSRFISHLSPSAGGVLSTTALKFCQRLLSVYESANTNGLIVYDLETIGNNFRTAEIIEIAAKKIGVRQKKESNIVFHQLVKPKNSIPKSSTDIHGITNEDVKDMPGIEEVLPKFLDFIGDSILVGHNIIDFDNKVIGRYMAKYVGRQELVNSCYDTFLIAKKLFPLENYKLDALATKFGINIEGVQLHRAIGDISLTEQIFRRLRREESARNERNSLKELLPLVAVGILDKNAAMEEENIAFYNATLRYIHNSRQHSSAIELLPISYMEASEEEEVIRFLDRIREENPPIDKEDEEWNSLKAKFQNSVIDFQQYGYNKSLNAFLDYSALLTGNDVSEESEDKVTMMTVHSAKGTEFPVVIMIGMEQGNFPIISSEQTESDLEEERRLCYVGMTRAKKQLYMTSVRYRESDRELTPSQFIWEIQPDLIKTIYPNQIRKALNKKRKKSGITNK